MFCHKCGSKVLEDAVFCPNCGAKLIKEGGRAQEFVESKPVCSASESTADIGVRLKENMSKCSAIKAVTQAKRGTVLKGRLLKYLVFIAATGQAVIIPSLSLPFAMLYAIPGGIAGGIASNIGWNLAENGSIYFEDYALMLALVLLIVGVLVAIHPFLVRKEKEAVTSYVREILESEGVSLVPGSVKTGISATRLVVSIALTLVGAVMLIFVMVENDLISFNMQPDNFRFGDIGEKAVTDFDDADTITNESVSLSQTYVNEMEGFSFMYPSSWNHRSAEGFDARKEMMSPLNLILEIYTLDDLGYGEDYYASYMQVIKVPVNLTFSGTIDDFESSLSLTMDEVNVTELLDIELSGLPARKLSYLFKDNGETCAVTEYYYVIGDDMYAIRFYALQKNFDKHESVFDAIMDSYTVTAVSTADESGAGSLISIGNEFRDDAIFGEALMMLITDNVLTNGDIADDFWDNNRFGYNKGIEGDGILLLHNWYPNQQGEYISTSGKVMRALSSYDLDTLLEIADNCFIDAYGAYKAYIDEIGYLLD